MVVEACVVLQKVWLLNTLFAFQGDDGSAQRYSADPTGLLSERGAKGDQEGLMAAVRDKKIAGDCR